MDMRIGIRKWMKSVLVIVYACVVMPASAQLYTGMNGLLHVPSAEMDSVGSTRVGVHYLPKAMMPDAMVFEGDKYASTNWYLSATPLRWLEVGYAFTLMKFRKSLKPDGDIGFYSKDRYFSLRIQPLYEGRYWPSVVIGSNDVLGQNDGESGSFYFRNFYIAASKHFAFPFGEFGAHLAYRYWVKDFNRKWNGVVGGVTFRPQFYPPLRFVAEFDGDAVNIGADCCLFKYVVLQASLMRYKYFSAGAALRVQLGPKGNLKLRKRKSN